MECEKFFFFHLSVFFLSTKLWIWNDPWKIKWGRHCWLIIGIKLQKLYELGARKFGIISVATVGCCPAVSSLNGGKCVEPLNDFAVAFYLATQALLQKLSSELKGFKYSLGNSFEMTSTLLKSPSSFGKHHIYAPHTIFIFNFNLVILLLSNDPLVPWLLYCSVFRWLFT